ncbi:MAG: hypothetical protein NVSMB13_17950 [Mycobacteriales bacterium]
MTHDRCPACGAACRSDAQWCTLCYADFRPAPVSQAPLAVLDRPVHPDVDEVVPTRRRGRHAAPVPDDETDIDDSDYRDHSDRRHPRDRPGASPAVRGWPCPNCSATTPMDRSTCDGCGLPFLADLQAGVPSVRLPGIGDVAQASKGVRMGVAAAAGLAAIVVLVGLLTLVGLLF